MKNAKVNIRKLCLIAASALLLSCCTKNRTNIYESSPDSILVNKIRKEVFAKLSIEEDLRPCGTGAQMMDEIKMLYFGFNYYHEVDINAARKLLINAENVALNKINDCDEIRPYLVNYPFKPINVQIDIFLRKPDGSQPEPQKLQVISIHEGNLDYMNHNLDTKFLTTILKETYEEALGKLLQEESIYRK